MLANRVRMGSYKGKKDDMSGSPGSAMLIAGDMMVGYFGTVPAIELFTGNEIKTRAGFAYGVVVNDYVEWFKFAYQGKIWFRPRLMIIHSVDYNTLLNLNLLNGGKTTAKNGFTFKFRVMSGVTSPADGFEQSAMCHYSEWNKLILPLTIQAKTKTWTTPANVENDVSYWGTDYAITEISGGIILTKDGYLNPALSDRVVCRDAKPTDSSYMGGQFKNYTSNQLGYAPVLELDYPAQL